MNIVLVTTVIASLFLVIGLAEPLAAKLRLPYIVILALLGILIGAGAIFFLRTDLTDALNPVAEAILGMPIRSNVFLHVFLPTLLFQATLGMNLRRMLDDWATILALAVVAVVVATLAVGYSLYWTSSLSIVACLLIGAIVSTTDPSVVISLFRSIAAPERLARIIEGESLLNDAAAIALFGLFMGFVMEGVPNPSLLGALAQFPMLIMGGVMVGWLSARIALMLMALVHPYELAQLSISLALPYLAYVGAEQSVGASGVIAVVTAGMTLNVIGPGRLVPQAWQNLREVWDLLAHWAGALIFILAALLIPRLLEEVRTSDVMLTGVVIVAAMAARAIILFGLLPLISALRLSEGIARPYHVAILWGGLRGAVTLALALAVTESIRVPPDIKRMVGILATGYTLFTLLVQGSTLRWLIGRLHLDRLSSVDQSLSSQVVAVTLQSVREEIVAVGTRYDLTQETVRSEARHFDNQLDAALQHAEDQTSLVEQDRLTLGLIALAGAERDMILLRIRELVISLRLADQSLANADRLIEATRSGGSDGYQRASLQNHGFSRTFRVTALLHEHLRLSAPLARATADRFELLLSQQMILRELHDFIDTRIRRIHGSSVSDQLHVLLHKRQHAVSQALTDLRLQYPHHAIELERNMLRRIALRLEERHYESMRDDGLIGSDLCRELLQGIATRRKMRWPWLALPAGNAKLLQQFPHFNTLSEATLGYLGRRSAIRHVNAGQVIVDRKDSPAGVFVLISGKVELQGSKEKIQRLGRGQLFGPVRLLQQEYPGTEVRAVAPTILLTMNESRFLNRLSADEELQRAVLHSAQF